MSYGHLFIDLETMGTRPGCAVVSIAAIQFDIESGKMGKRFYTAIDLESNVHNGLVLEPSTVEWWKKQSDQARKKISTDTISLTQAVIQFNEFYNSLEKCKVWGNSASFDCSIWQAATEAVDMQIPWHYRDECCYRTLTNLFKINKFTKDSKKAHDPIYDCEYQIKVLALTWSSIKTKNYV